jgi:phage gp46-like protein
MSDLRLDWTPAIAGADLAFDGFDFAVDGGLRSAVIISLFSDARVAADDLPAGEDDPRGFWADGVAPSEPGDNTGSRLWLLERAKLTDADLRRAEDLAREALAWMIQDGVAKRITARARRLREGATAGLGLQIAVERPDGQSRFEFAWGGR